MSATPGPTSLATSIISATLSSIISTPTSNIISNAISATSRTPTSMTFYSSSASPSPTTTSKGGGFGFTDDTLTKMGADAKNTSDITSQFVICFVAGIVCFLAFCIFRTRFPVLFSPRLNMKRHKPPELPTSLFGWILPLIRIGDEEMLENVGLDALLMLKFIVMGIQIFSILTLLGIIVFVPITMTADYSHLTKLTTVSRISMEVIEDGDSKLIAYLIFAYIFTFITFVFLKRSYHEYIYLRAKFLLKQSKMMVSRSVVVTGIPQHLRSDQALSEYYENLGIGAVESCYVVREVHRLNTLIKKRANALICLEDAYASYWGNPCRLPGYDPDRILDDVEMYKKVLDLAEKRPDSSSDEEEELQELDGAQRSKKKKPGNTTFFKGLVEPKFGLKKKTSKRPTVRVGGLFGLFGKKVDAIEYYTKLFDDLDKTVNDRRKSPNFEMANVGFVTFERMSSAVVASQIAINPEPFNCRTIMAWEPRDILWESIGIRGRERVIREIVIWTITVALCLGWAFPVTAISSLLSAQSLGKIDPSITQKIEDSYVASLIFNSFVPTIILNIFTSILPFIFDALGYYQGLRSRSAVAESTLSKYYFFLIFLTLILYSVIGATFEVIWVSFTHDIQNIPEFIADVLPTLAPFFINYTMLQTFLIMPLNLLLLGSIIIRGFYHMFLCKTPREHAENRAPWAFNYGIGYPAPLLIFAIVFEYSLICPLILLFGTVYFCITYVVYKYQFLYVYFRPYEAAGKLWTMVIPRIIFTLVLFQLTMMGIFLLGKSYVLGGLCVPLIVITFVFYVLLEKAYKENGENLPMQLLQEEKVPTPEEEAKAKEMKMIARNRWKKAALSAVNLKAETPAEDKSIIIRPRHRKLVLDEDDYEATPDRLTDYRQPPMQLNPGILDAGLKKYGNPLLVGVLPQLWLPVK
ncbi:uncharacterized protein EV154DRAFT_441952, partial [Mucor mucedo]|uniref:uncharacterized protein n=1 Tax=Mucor mucedo TaxID=29922 RepID=UPI00221FCB51